MARTIRKKIKTLAELEDICHALRAEGRRIVQCHGVFDLLHPGHLRHFEAARAEGDLLIVTVTPDRFVNKGPGRPAFSEGLRAESVAALEMVAYVALTGAPSAADAIRRLRPAVYAKGSDYLGADDPTGQLADERRAVEEAGGRLHFTPEAAFSSSRLLNRHFDVYPEAAQDFLQRFRQRHAPDAIVAQLKRLRSLKTLVIGDAIVDEYHYVQAMQRSAKELLLTTRYLREEHFAGGALACANHVAGFCDQVDLVTVLGTDDPRREFILRHLKANVSPTFFLRDDAGTPVKRRYIEQAFLSKMFEVAFLGESELPAAVSRRVAAHLAATLARYDLVIVADYGHGCLTRELIRVLTGARFLAVTVQTNSANLGFNLVSKYPRADYVCIDEPELRLAAHDRTSTLEDLVPPLAKAMTCGLVSITQGHKGSLTYAPPSVFPVPALSREVVDRLGAGDAYLAVTAPCAAAGCDPELVGFIGNAVGALAVGIVGNRTAVDPLTLERTLTALLR